MAFDSVPLDDGLEDGQEPSSIDIVAVDRHLGVSARDHVIEGACGKERRGRDTPHRRAARMNPVAIFVGLLFWTWVWGVWGTVLAVPML